MIDVDFTFEYPKGARIECAWRHSSADGHVTVLLGPSGSGKTTLLRCLAGLERPRRGHIRVDDQVWLDSAARVCVPPNRRDIGVLFQDYALFPHLSAEQNITYAHAVPARDRLARLGELLEIFRLRGLESRMPQQLSGGQQQRVALARALFRRPKLLLLDEPLSALDAVTRDDVRDELRVMIRQLDIPLYIVSHDRVDALALADRTVLMDHGRIVQSGPTPEVFEHPATPTAARLVGVETVLIGSIARVDAGLATVMVADQLIRAEAPAVSGAEVALCIRAEDVVLAHGADLDMSAMNRWRAVVRHHTLEGPFVRVALDCGFGLSALVTRDAWQHLALRPGDVAVAIVKAASIRVLPRH